MWRQVLAREGRAARADFLPVETMLCFALGLATDPSPSGFVNVKKASPVTKQIAVLLGRPPGSLQSKHSNLEARPGRDGGRFSDPAVGQFFASDLDRFASYYARAIDAARAEGISDDRLSDFLGNGSGQLRAVIDASRISDDQLWESIEASSTSGDGALTTVQRVVSVRLSQQRFARAVLERSNFCCVFCGLSTRRVGLPSARMLVAGHIKPWRHSSRTERNSSSNGFAACPTHDAAFEAHLLTVQSDGRIEVSRPLERAISRDASWQAAFSHVSSHVLLPASAIAASAPWVEWHRSAAQSAIESQLLLRSTPLRSGGEAVGLD